MKKFIFYGTFMAMGVFWAEVVSMNIPWALLHPLLYLAYGLLYVLFLDHLLRRDIRDFKVWYLCGALVGLITETYVAKVTFYGAGTGTYRIAGVAPVAIAFILLFYHAFYSFLGPVWLARWALNMPFPLSCRKWSRVLLLSPPLIFVIVLNQTSVLIPAAVRQAGISVLVLMAWSGLLYAQGDIENVLLSRWARRLLAFLATGIYGIFLVTATNAKAHGHAPMDFPLVPMLVVSMVIGATLLLCLESGGGKEEMSAVPYSPRGIRWGRWMGWIGWYVFGGMGLLVILPLIRPAIIVLFWMLGIGGTVAGAGMFIISFCSLIRGRMKAG